MACAGDVANPLYTRQASPRQASFREGRPEGKTPAGHSLITPIAGKVRRSFPFMPAISPPYATNNALRPLLSRRSLKKAAGRHPNACLASVSRPVSPVGPGEDYCHVINDCFNSISDGLLLNRNALIINRIH